jgi:hypothetical protein
VIDSSRRQQESAGFATKYVADIQAGAGDV